MTLASVLSLLPGMWTDYEDRDGNETRVIHQLVDFRDKANAFLQPVSSASKSEISECVSPISKRGPRGKAPVHQA